MKVGELQVSRYFVMQQDHSTRCFEPHCAESRFWVFDRISGVVITKRHSEESANSEVETLNTEWEQFEERATV
jgi:hypothetical protein